MIFGGSGLVSHFPASWLTSVTVLRDGGRDPKGNPLPATEIPLDRCLIGPRSTGESVAGSSLTSSDMSIYRDLDPTFRFQPADRIRVPAGALNAGEWSVDGRPKEFPLGVEVPVKAGP